MKKLLLLLSLFLFINVSFANDYKDTKIINSKVINLVNYKYLIPAYWWSYDLNKKLLEVNKAIVIVNPGNGDFEKAQEVFDDMIEKTHTNDNLAIGYVYTLYGKRNLSTVKQRIDNWLKEYPSIEGFFFDEVSSSKDELEFYTEIYNYVKSKNKNLIVILNPGTTPDKGYINISDNIVLYETYCEKYSEYKQPTWINEYTNSKFSYLGLRCSQSQYNTLSNKYKNYIQYFTNDGNDSNTWDSLSKYALTENENSINIKFKNLQFNRLEEDFGKYNKYYKIFEKVFNSKKNKILNNSNYQNIENYGTLKSFNAFTNKLFLDIKNKDLESIKLYLKDLKKVIKDLKKIK